MRITPLDVRKQEFRRVVRGLDADEVYAFLTTVADEYEACLSDNKQLREKVIDLDEKVSEYRNMETTLRDTLLTAERVMAEARQNARKEAELILRDATMRANGQTAHIAAEVEALKNQLRELRGQRDAFLARLQSLAESQVTLVESFRKDFENEDAERSAQRVGGVTETTSPAPVVSPVDPVDSVDSVDPAETVNPVETVAGAFESPELDGREDTAGTPVANPTSEADTTPVETPPAGAAPTQDEWRDYTVGSMAAGSTDTDVVEGPVATAPEAPAPAAPARVATVPSATAPVAAAPSEDSSTATLDYPEVPTSVYESEADAETAIEVASENPPEVAVTETTPAPPVETAVDQLGVDPSEEDPVDRIARMMAEAAAVEEEPWSPSAEPTAASGGHEQVAVATSATPTESGELQGEESADGSRWSLSRFTKGLANF